MSFKTAIELTKKYYGNYPGPTEETYALAEKVADFFKENAISAAGVIAVAIGSDKYHYLGLSPALQKAVMTQMIDEAGGSALNGHFRLGRGLEAYTGVKFDLSRKVSTDIVGKASFNKGCAEKKIVSNMYLRKVTLKEISVIPFPETIFAESIPAHIVVASADGAYIAPCATCLQIYPG
ncbi:hypothetical protein [Paraburkholderia sp. Cpub6]|uniref:hypothetical protein n=2 Tax=Paraburkholderia TaxID=1822464 RepID=UPI0016206F54|nr:hypothetical protein [Paraburkholderia sp. Cpub6]MBB5463851.1 hypothetical protein [Paraburkholderia sp. Cpub6]